MPWLQHRASELVLGFPYGGKHFVERPWATCSGILLYEQQPPRLGAIERIHSIEQPFPFDQPWLKVEVDVEHEDEVFGFEIASNWGMMSAASTKDPSTIEIDDVASAWIVGATEMLMKLVETGSRSDRARL